MTVVTEGVRVGGGRLSGEEGRLNSGKGVVEHMFGKLQNYITLRHFQQFIPIVFSSFLGLRE